MSQRGTRSALPPAGGRRQSSQAFASQSSSSSQSSQSQRRRRIHDDSEEEEEEERTSSQRLPAKRAKSASQRPEKEVVTLSLEEKEKLVGDLMRYMIFSNYKKKSVDKKKLREAVLKEAATLNKQATNIVIEEARKRFVDIFGYELIELGARPTKKSGASASSSTAHSEKYVLRNCLGPPEVRSRILGGGRKAAQLGLLSVVLSLIHLTEGNKLDEATLHALLERLGLSRMEEEHPKLGNWQELLSSFVEQGYLTKVETTMPGGAQRTYALKFGLRAEAEIDQKRLKDFVMKMHGSAPVLTPAEGIE